MAEHRRLRRKSTSLGNELDEAEWAKGHPPSELITWRNYTTSGGAIKHRRDQLLSEAGANAEQIELEYRKAKADERARKRARREWYKRNGLADLKAKYNEISGAENVALFAVRLPFRWPKMCFASSTVELSDYTEKAPGWQWRRLGVLPRARQSECERDSGYKQSACCKHQNGSGLSA